MDPRWNIINSLGMKRKLIYNNIILGFRPFVFFSGLWRNLSKKTYQPIASSTCICQIPELAVLIYSEIHHEHFQFPVKMKTITFPLTGLTSVPCHDFKGLQPIGLQEMMLKGKHITNPVFPKMCFVFLAPHQVSIKSFNNSRILWRYFSFPPKTCRQKTGHIDTLQNP